MKINKLIYKNSLLTITLILVTATPLAVKLTEAIIGMMRIILTGMTGYIPNLNTVTNARITIDIHGSVIMASVIIFITRVADTISIFVGSTSNGIFTLKLGIIMGAIIVTTIIQDLFMRHLPKLCLVLTQRMHGL